MFPAQFSEDGGLQTFSCAPLAGCQLLEETLLHPLKCPNLLMKFMTLNGGEGQSSTVGVQGPECSAVGGEPEGHRAFRASRFKESTSNHPKTTIHHHRPKSPSPAAYVACARVAPHGAGRRRPSGRLAHRGVVPQKTSKCCRSRVSCSRLFPPRSRRWRCWRDHR